MPFVQASPTPAPAAGRTGGTTSAGEAGALASSLVSTYSTGSRGNPPIGRIPVLDVTPTVNGGRWPAKAVVGEAVPVTATVFREGHDAVAASAVLIDPDGARHTVVRMTPGPAGSDSWSATLTPDRTGAWTYLVEGWSDPYGTWEHDATIKVHAGVDVDLMLEEGARLLERASARPEVAPEAAYALMDAVAALRDPGLSPVERLNAGLAPAVHAALAVHPLRDLVSPSEPLRLEVQRERALFSAWYELFPRSEGAHVDEAGNWVSGTLRQAEARLPKIKEMGFDIVYLPPIHPIGRVNRKGPNNTLTPGPQDPGVPWAIGSDEGGHDAVHPGLGTIEDVDHFVAAAADLGLEVALDLALQCAPDHPWATEHPEWFTQRADGTIAYAENPPKKYQDIYPLNFDNDPVGLAEAVLDVVKLWIDHGITVFRVDNPHTKPVAFWEWLLGEVNKKYPHVLFLAEAFTRPAMMHTLAKIGFHQSYTYFTWRTAKWEITEYVEELRGSSADYMRPNFWPNTPDILHEFLQYGGPPAFKLRATLAATLSPSWGMYSGYELCEHVAVRGGSEEYLDSEKYQYRPRDWASYEPGGDHEDRTIAPFIASLNGIRRSHRALHRLRNTVFHHCDDDQVIAYSRRLESDPTTGEPEDVIIVVVNLDPHGPRETGVHLNMPELGMDWFDGFEVEDLLTGQRWPWQEHNYVRLDPFHSPAHVLSVRRN
ncbi:alpha-1,4-glucan--maltose-1-phosphate maltosyltransferase [Spongisporangium articulatum]|uniref:Alpha-1,4-glucan:maltose-1-phosphate maltosyltransferase n=1 Tax=Spongisporangium articulatum TaxID=3362603 RepID=A0ABW8AN85_9ACTN